jgi:hypothetical protein
MRILMIDDSQTFFCKAINLISSNITCVLAAQLSEGLKHGVGFMPTKDEAIKLRTQYI